MVQTAITPTGCAGRDGFRRSQAWLSLPKRLWTLPAGCSVRRHWGPGHRIDAAASAMIACRGSMFLVWFDRQSSVEAKKGDIPFTVKDPP